MEISDPYIGAVAQAVRDIPEEHFVEFPGGYPDEISTALIDAVYSARQRYYSETPGVGVYNRVQKFREAFPDVRNNLQQLVGMEESQIRSILGDNVVADGRQTRKSVVVQRAAGNMLELGVQYAGDLEDADSELVKKAYTSVRGLGWITFEYFLMLLGQPGIKADVMITRFVNAALTERGMSQVDSKQARQILETVHAQDGVARGLGLTDFDHTIWRWQRGR
ncbi:hypothetical protein [Nesterenkonia sp. K-15-9-6]|uniref:hypothetical protein n=1 Tax=Nesterenkonia sp. K-15-9-6 TaxID=3093918 RepID=UPI00404422EC